MCVASGSIAAQQKIALCRASGAVHNWDKLRTKQKQYTFVFSPLNLTASFVTPINWIYVFQKFLSLSLLRSSCFQSHFMPIFLQLLRVRMSIGTKHKTDSHVSVFRWWKVSKMKWNLHDKRSSGSKFIINIPNIYIALMAAKWLRAPEWLWMNQTACRFVPTNNNNNSFLFRYPSWDSIRTKPDHWLQTTTSTARATATLES